MPENVRMVDIIKLLGLERDFVLASRSPRRYFLLDMIGLDFEVIPSGIDEDVDENMPPADYAEMLARMKSAHVASSLGRPGIVLGADTIVALDGMILNKPSGREEAHKMLAILSGRTHTVYTGIALTDAATGLQVSAVEATRVTFRELSGLEIDAYIATGSPLDKAGAYGIQDDFGAVFVSRIEGCYYNIVGLPLQLLYVTMRDFISKLKAAGK